MRPWLEGEGGLGLDVVGKGIEWKACMGENKLAMVKGKRQEGREKLASYMHT